ncbi:Amuc_1098 family type IV pilus outer membrane protein [Roseibacillus persicicus]|uniref:Type II/III secretion system secretin-like domain-containing protein n=1 Tax=Roseibacillus persicicus TaxID=454148 RepID=A0A918WJR1_9BACT|nr:Amuc_1098 family type IV pilus outer membrane protein [Roseibacillus persicicus]GHC52728.1 hypothetical protein GCM10007100_18880 [Roseibacillus persicicus]
MTLSLPGQSVVQQELERRRDNVIAAEEAIMAGDDAYQKSDFQEAVSKYREAFAKVPAGDKTDKFREAARERYAQAAVQAARVMNRQGDRQGAIEMVDEVLGKDVFPEYFPAQKLRAQLDDPIRSNPSATEEHGQNIDEVRRLLYQAEGAYNLADFDQSMALYNKVLVIDPYNKAARRGLERNNSRISDYADAARDHTRAELISQVDSQWELKKNQDVQVADGIVTEGAAGGTFGISGANQIEAKLDNIIVPFVDFEETSLVEAVEFLEGQSRALDPEIMEENKGIDFVMNMGSGNSPEIDELLQRRFSFRLRNVPLRQVVEYVTRQSGTSFRVDSYAVVIQPASGLTDDVVVKRYQVPPNFLSQTSGSVADSDPFGSDSGGGGTLAPRLTAREYLENAGVPFPDGSSASYNSSLGQLVVKTTEAGHDEVRGIVDALNLQEPIAVVIETKIVRVSQENLEEFNVDVAIQNLEASGDLVVGGGTVGNGRQSDYYGGNPITSGLRSGDFATSGDAIETVLNDEGGASLNSAPGFLSMLGIANDHAVSVLLRGLNQKKGTDILSQPSVVTRSGQQAIVESTRELIYPTEYEPPELPNSVGATLIDINTGIETDAGSSFSATPSHPTAFETRKLGTFLEVQPTVSADRTYADLAFNLNIEEFLGFINYGEPIQGGSSTPDFGIIGAGSSISGEVTSNDILMPLFNVVRLNTNISVGTGETILLGGVLNEKVEMVEDKVPVLGDVPFLGKLFRSDALQRNKSVVMVFVTVRIVDPAGNPVQK